MAGEIDPGQVQQLNDISKQITEIHEMIDHFIQQGYPKEVAFFRQVLQAAKISKRRLDHS